MIEDSPHRSSVTDKPDENVENTRPAVSEDSENTAQIFLFSSIAQGGGKSGRLLFIFRQQGGATVAENFKTFLFHHLLFY